MAGRACTNRPVRVMRLTLAASDKIRGSAIFPMQIVCIMACISGNPGGGTLWHRGSQGRVQRFL